MFFDSISLPLFYQFRISCTALNFCFGAAASCISNSNEFESCNDAVYDPEPKTTGHFINDWQVSVHVFWIDPETSLVLPFFSSSYTFLFYFPFCLVLGSK